MKTGAEFRRVLKSADGLSPGILTQSFIARRITLCCMRGEIKVKI